MRPSVPAAALVVLLLAPASGFGQAPAPAATPAAPKVLVFPFAALGEQARANAELLRKNLVNAIDQLKDVDALDPIAAEKALGKPLVEARDSCGDDAVCLQALASVAGARFLVRGGLLVEATGGFTVMLQAFDAERGAIHREPTPHKVASEAAAVESMNTAANWMFATTGMLVLHTPVAADVFVNSKPLGKRTPVDRAVNLPLEAGKANIRLEAAGWEPYSEIVTIKPGGTTTLKPLMKQKSIAAKPPATVVKKPITKQPLFWGAVAAGVIALGAGAAVAASSSGGAGTKTDTQPGDNEDPSTTITGW